MSRGIQQTRSMQSELVTRNETADELIIEGYFAVFNVSTELWRGIYEKLAPTAFEKTLGNDIRALANHETLFVLGRNKAGTLTLHTDAKGLYGRIKINPNDRDAMNLYERVKRGDVDQCSFGFNIVDENEHWRDDGTVEYTINQVDLREVSVVTFPAYTETGVEARKASAESRRLERQKQNLKARLRKHGT